MTPSLPKRRATLQATLGFAHLTWRERPPVVSVVETWLNSWRGVGHIVVGMHAQGYDVELRQYAAGWRANFYWTGAAHSVVTGSAWEGTPWQAVQRAALQALRRNDT